VIGLGTKDMATVKLWLVCIVRVKEALSTCAVSKNISILYREDAQRSVFSEANDLHEIWNLEDVERNGTMIIKSAIRALSRLSSIKL
jgi:U3 small nucleolar ribonucleoprotein component